MLQQLRAAPEKRPYNEALGGTYVSKKSRIGLIIGIVAVLVLAVRVLIAFERFSTVERDFESIQNGQSRTSVNTKFGKPNYYSGKCGTLVEIPAVKNCAVEYVYSHPLAPLLPDYYVISFSADGRVIQADHWVSP
jgi:hypothetical protein